jgi:hypothetical protein
MIARQLLRFLSLLLLVCHAQAGEPIGFTVLGASGTTYLRWITEKSNCPTVSWASGKQQAMTLRIGKSVIPERSGRIQIDNKASNFAENVCEIEWQAKEKKAKISGQIFKSPPKRYQRILFIGDTGCRMKASENAFQDCNHKNDWPFSLIAEAAAKKSPDLVVHLGDIHYRESPCPSDKPGCQKSPWGYGSDAWRADFFEPAKKLLTTTPWLFVRGNHESCARAGQGWFRYIDPNPWQNTRSCNRSEDDHLADYSPPYAFQLNDFSQLIVFDSSATTGKPLNKESQMFITYKKQLSEVNNFLEAKQQSIFLSHHPLLAVSPQKSNATVTAGGNKGLLSVFEDMNPQELTPRNMSWMMHGHIHAFEVLNFKTNHPSTIVMGNSGSMMEGVPPQKIPDNFEVANSAIVENFTSTDTYGFAILEIPNQENLAWTLSEFDVSGRPLVVCQLAGRKSTCVQKN